MSYTKMLSQFGVSSAHPGGFTATLKQLEHFQLSPESKILEVGCGTGRTACLLAEKGYQVTAIDHQESMIKKAARRAKLQGLDVVFMKGDACSIPFEDHQFDVVIVESVTNFTNASTALAEYYRVLKRGGTMYDRELIAINTMPSDMEAPLLDFFKFEKLRSLNEWLMILTNIGFQSTYWDLKTTLLDETNQTVYPDNYQYVDRRIIENIHAFRTAIEYGEIIDAYKDYLGSVVLVGSKI